MAALKRAWELVRNALPGWWDLHVYGGFALIAYGVGSAWFPGGAIVLGALLSGLGLWFYGRVEGD